MRHSTLAPLLLLLTSACGSPKANSAPSAQAAPRGDAAAQATKSETPAAGNKARTRTLSHRAVVHEGLASPDEETVITRVGEYEALGKDGKAQVLIEIPAGTIAKFEGVDGTNELKLEYVNGRPRLIDFLPYPVNYGAIPKTLVDPAQGGDGNWADVLLLGPALERGQIVSVRLIGMMKMLDGGEIDHKLIAVTETEHEGFSSLRTFAEFKARYPNALPILQTWFESYKGPGKVIVQGFTDETEAAKFLEDCIAAYRKAPAP